LVVLNRIYTRTGDDGTTALGTGERRRKSDARVAAYGTVDETNAAIGLARLATATESPDLDAMLGRIQNDLFDLGADLATPPAEGEAEGSALRIVQAQVDRLEREIDALAEGRGESVSGPALAYVNRLSDFLFVASRHCNHLAGGDVLWVPGKNRV